MLKNPFFTFLATPFELARVLVTVKHFLPNLMIFDSIDS
jgi:hypothetical protein